MLDQLERRFRHFAVPNLTLYLVVGQGFFFLVSMARPDLVGLMVLVPALVLQGEVWRLLAFLFMPPATNPIFAFFALYLLYLFGTALENHWGAFRYNVYILIAYVATIAAACLNPGGVATNLYIDSSVFLAFAFLYPDFELYLFFILPVKVKWLALITWIMYGGVLLFGAFPQQALVLAAISNFLLFFWPDLLQRVRGARRRMKMQSEAAALRDEPFHRCATCGKTDRSHPQLEFRYCDQCDGSPGYCIDHINAHEHQ